MTPNPYYEMILHIVKEERLTIWGLQEKYDLGSGFASTVYRMKKVPKRVPHPTLLGKLEEKIGIVIDDSDINHITYKRKDSQLYKTIAEATDNEPIGEVPPHLLPLFEEGNLETIAKIFRQQEGDINRSKLSSVASRYIRYPSNCSENSIAGRITTNKNDPFILFNDIVILDFDEKVENNNFVVLILNDNNWHIGRVYREGSTHIILFYNYNYNPIVINNSQVSKVVKIVGIIRELK